MCVCVCVCVDVPEQCCSSSVVDVLCSSEERIVQSMPLPSPNPSHSDTHHTHTHTHPPTHLLWHRHIHTHAHTHHPPHRYGVSSLLLTMTDMPVAVGLSVSQSSLQGALDQRHAGRLQPVDALD